MLKKLIRVFKAKPIDLHTLMNRGFAIKKPAAMPKTGIPSFKNYQFLPPVEEYINNKNLESPSPIQQMAFNHFMQLKGRIRTPIFLGGPTGSGKTFAYLLPIINALKLEEQQNGRIARLPNRPRAVILAPSKELINQIYEIAKEISHLVKLKVEKIDGASNWNRKARDLKEGVDILVTNINKFERLTHEKKIQLSSLKYFVIDEADVFIETGAEKEMIDYAKNLYLKQEVNYQDIQLVYVSATLTKSLRIFLETVFDREIKFLLTTDTHFNLANLKHTFVPILEQNRLELLKSELVKLQKKNKEGYFLVFCNSVASVRAVDYYLKSQGLNCSSLHSDMPVRLRSEAYQNFKNKQTNIMVCSDLAARGLDFVHLNGVINFDFPKNINDYLHRAGRAGRIGNFGVVLNLYHSKDLPIIKQLEESYENKIPLEITQSSFALKNKEDKKDQLATKNMKNSGLPSNYVDFRKNLEDTHPIKKLGRSRRPETKPEMKKPKDFLRRKVRDIKGSLKMLKKINPNSKRVVYLKRELKRKHKERLGIAAPPKRKR